MFPKKCNFENMEEQIENIDGIVKKWKESSDQNYLTMQNLLKSRDYSWSLFLGHLVIEKLLKAHYVKKTPDTCRFYSRPASISPKS